MLKKWFDRLKTQPLVATVVTHYQSAEIDLSSIAVAYYLLLTLFPILVLIGNIFPYLNINTVELLTFLEKNLPSDLFDIVSSLVVTIFNTPSSGLVWFSIVTGLWTMSRGFFFLQKAVNKAYDNSDDQRDMILGRLIGVLSGIILIVFLAVGVLVSTFGQAFLTLLHARFALPADVYDLLLALLQPLVLMVFVVALAVLYFLLPNVRITKFCYVLPGTLFTSLILVASANFFGLYVNQTIGKLENIRVLGSVTLLVLMFWFVFFAKVIITGAVLNASYQVYKEGDLIARRGTVKELVSGKKED